MSCSRNLFYYTSRGAVPNLSPSHLPLPAVTLAFGTAYGIKTVFDTTPLRAYYQFPEDVTTVCMLPKDAANENSVSGHKDKTILTIQTPKN
jgi:hypothetical protein